MNYCWKSNNQFHHNVFFFIRFNYFCSWRTSDLSWRSRTSHLSRGFLSEGRSSEWLRPLWKPRPTNERTARSYETRTQTVKGDFTDFSFLFHSSGCSVCIRVCIYPGSSGWFRVMTSDLQPPGRETTDGYLSCRETISSLSCSAWLWDLESPDLPVIFINRIINWTHSFTFVTERIKLRISSSLKKHSHVLMNIKEVLVMSDKIHNLLSVQSKLIWSFSSLISTNHVEISQS